MQKLLHTLYITEPDTVLRRDGEALVAVHANGREDHIPLHLLDRIVCFSGASISPAVIDACVKHDVGFSALSQSGRFCFRLNGPTTGNVLLRKKQYTLPCENRLYLAKRMLHGKLEGQATVLGRFRRNHPSELLRATEEAIRTIAEQLPMAVTNEGLRGLEGQAARLYFDAFGRMILTEDKAFRFEGRNRRPPRDRCNAMKNIDFGNGRYVRTIVERAAMAQASRLLNERDGEISNADIRLLCEEDFTAAIHREKEDQRMPMGFAG